jgi:hypothetical protein
MFVTALSTELPSSFFETCIFRNLMFWHWRHSPLVLLIPSWNLFASRSLKLITDGHSSTKDQEKYIKHISFPWPPVVAAHLCIIFCFLFTQAMKLLPLIYKLFMIRWSVKIITQYQILVSIFYHVYLLWYCKHYHLHHHHHRRQLKEKEKFITSSSVYREVMQDSKTCTNFC